MVLARIIKATIQVVIIRMDVEQIFDTQKSLNAMSYWVVVVIAVILATFP